MSISVGYAGTSILQGIQPTSIECAQLADMGETATGAFTVEDDAAALTLIGYQPVTISESACSQPRLFTGWTFERGYQRDEENAILTGSARTHDVSIIDMNACFGFRQITRTGAGGGNRPAETWLQRLTWILGSEYLSPYISSSQAFVIANTTAMDAADYRGSYPSAVMNDLSDRSGNAYDYFAFWDPLAKEVRLFFNNDAASIGDSVLRISNVLSEQDQVTTFGPDKIAKLQRESDQVYSDVCVNYADGTLKLYRSRPSTYATYVRRSTQIDRPYTRGVATATAQAEAFLDKHSVETDRVTCTIRVPRARVGLIQAGQRVQFKAPHMPDYSAFTWMRVVMCTPKPADETGYWYDVALELVYRPTVGSTNPCVEEGPTATGSYAPLNSWTPSDEIIYFRAGCSFDSPCQWSFGELGAGGSPDYAGDNVSNTLWIRVIGAGTGTIHTATYGGSVRYLSALLGNGTESSDFVLEETLTASIVTPTDIVFTVPDDGHCSHLVQITDVMPSGGGKWGFAGFDWVALEDAPDTVVDLGPTPGATTTHAVPPTVDDDESLGYTVGSTWIDTATGKVYVLTDSTDGAAVWVETSGAGVSDHGLLTGLTDDDHTQYVLKRYGGKEVVSTVAATGATETIDLANGNVFDETLSADCTFTFAGATNGVACSFTLLLRQDGTGGWTTTWPGSVVWAGGSAPTLDETASTVAVLTFFTIDGGTVWYGFPTGGGGGTPATTVTDETTWGITPAVGSDTEYARQDHTHGSAANPVTAVAVAALGFVGPILISDTPSTPLVFADLIQNEAEDDLVYGDL